MINFKKIELNDKQWMEPLLDIADLPGGHQNFTNLFAWSETYHYLVAQVKGYLVVKGLLNDLPYYFYPAGSGDIEIVFEAMQQDAASSGHEFVLVGVSPEDMAVMNRVFPDRFEYEEMRDNYDYVYLVDKLVTLSGNKLHAKRNYINRFKKEHLDWKFEQISLENLANCWEMNQEWCKINAPNESVSAQECCAVRRCFNNFVTLGLEGGLIRAEGKVIAFTMGERLNSNTYITHIEKAFSAIAGSYQMINREFAALIQKNYPEQIYVNREEDMGFEGLRKAKLSYHPEKMEEKYFATYCE
ncbi:MAG TPA: phosphatidylglycerol lysyltransferase domain-containing protein [Desulfosporosinus sp.]|nr:phosphatidylglycerol lysyltransferase domain-containing protein [Desulfosporosinus sp.]